MSQGQTEISKDRARRIYEYSNMTLAEHEQICCVCSYWLGRREEIRCAEYRGIQLIRDKWHQLEKMWDQYSLGEHP
jgi:hypothetical protein